MAGLRLGAGSRLPAALLMVALGACAGDHAPTAPGHSATASLRQALTAATSPTAVGCDTLCVVLQNMFPFRAARVQPDSAESRVVLASFRISGQANGVVLLHLIADATWWAAVPDTAVIEVVADSVRSTVPLSALKTESVVYRFASSKVVDLRLELRRQFPDLPAASVQLVQRVQGGRLLQATTPWRSQPVSTTMTNNKSCGFTAPGMSCGVKVTISPFSQGTAWTSTGFQSGSGTGPSSTIHITFSKAVNGFSVNVYDPDYAGNQVVAYNAKGQVVGQVAVPFDGTPGVLTIEPVTIAASGITAIDLIPAPADYVAYDNAQILTSAVNLTVTCAPNSVVRGNTMTCTVSPPQGSTSTTISQWQFTNTQFSVVNTSNPGLTWSGTVAAGGTVTATGQVDGTPATGSTTFTVSNRNWTQAPDTVSFSLINAIPDGLPIHPTVESDLGRESPLAQTDYPGGVSATIQGGPNDGIVYFVQVPVRAQSTVYINREALAVGSDFYNLQPISAPSGQCTQDSVAPFLPLDEAHEGLTLDPTNSHAGVLRAQLNLNTPPVAETLKAVNLSDLENRADGVLTPLINNAITASLDNNVTGGTVPPIPYCAFKFF